MKRIGLLIALLAWGWITMTVVHELGHISAGCVCGGVLKSVQLRPWHLPYSFFAPDPRPLITLWAGPLLGCVIPLAVAGIFRRRSLSFVAWFCVLANGAYLLVGWYAGDAELDSTKMMKAGTPSWLLLVVAGAMTAIGYVAFRSECQHVLNSETKLPSRRTLSLSWIALTCVLVVQTCFAMLAG